MAELDVDEPARVWVVVDDDDLRIKRCVGLVPGCNIGSPRSMLKAELGSKRSGCSHNGEGEAGGGWRASSSSESTSISTSSSSQRGSERARILYDREEACAPPASSREPARSIGCEEGPAMAFTSIPLLADAELTSEPEPLLTPR